MKKDPRPELVESPGRNTAFVLVLHLDSTRKPVFSCGVWLVVPASGSSV